LIFISKVRNHNIPSQRKEKEKENNMKIAFGKDYGGYLSKYTDDGSNGKEEEEVVPPSGKR